MKIITILAFLITTTFSLAVIADGIPATFQGKWAESAAVCTAKGAKADTIVTVDSKGYQGYEIFCEIKNIVKLTPTTLVAKGSCNEEAQNFPALIKMTLIKAGKGLKLNESTYIRCLKR